MRRRDFLKGLGYGTALCVVPEAANLVGQTVEWRETWIDGQWTTSTLPSNRVLTEQLLRNMIEAIVESTPTLEEIVPWKLLARVTPATDDRGMRFVTKTHLFEYRTHWSDGLETS